MGHNLAFTVYTTPHLEKREKTTYPAVIQTTTNQCPFYYQNPIKKKGESLAPHWTTETRYVVNHFHFQTTTCHPFKNTLLLHSFQMVQTRHNRISLQTTSQNTHNANQATL